MQTFVLKHQFCTITDFDMGHRKTCHRNRDETITIHIWIPKVKQNDKIWFGNADCLQTNTITPVHSRKFNLRATFFIAFLLVCEIKTPGTKFPEKSHSNERDIFDTDTHSNCSRMLKLGRKKLIVATDGFLSN